MSKLTELIRSEPVMARGLLAVLVTYVLSTLTSFGVVLSEAQQNALTGLVGIIMLVVLFLIRAKVTPADLVVAKETKGGVVVAGAAAAQPTGAEVTVADPEVVTAGRDALDAGAEAQYAESLDQTAEPADEPVRLGDIEAEEDLDDVDDSPAVDGPEEV